MSNKLKRSSPKFDQLRQFLDVEEFKYDIVMLEYDGDYADLAVLNGDGFVIKIFRDGTWDFKEGDEF